MKHCGSVFDSSVCEQVAGVTALACGMIAVGSCNGDVTSTILQTIMEKSEQELKDTYARWLPLGLGLNHLGETKHITLKSVDTLDCPSPVGLLSIPLLNIT